MLPVYVDLDDVLSETALAFLNILERDFGKTVPYEAITSFDLQEAFQLTQAEYDELFKIAHMPEEIIKLNPVEGSVEGITALSEKGYEIAIITGRLTSTYESTLEWLSLQNIPFDTFTFVNKYHRTEMENHMAITLEELSSMEFSFAVEDSLKMAKFLSNHMDLHVALLDRPWNQALESNHKVSRHTNWDQLIQYMNSNSS